MASRCVPWSRSGPLLAPPGHSTSSLPEHVRQERPVTLHPLALIEESRKFGGHQILEVRQLLAPRQHPRSQQDQSVRPFASGLFRPFPSCRARPKRPLCPGFPSNPSTVYTLLSSALLELCETSHFQTSGDRLACTSGLHRGLGRHFGQTPFHRGFRADIGSVPKDGIRNLSGDQPPWFGRHRNPELPVIVNGSVSLHVECGHGFCLRLLLWPNGFRCRQVSLLGVIAPVRERHQCRSDPGRHCSKRKQ